MVKCLKTVLMLPSPFLGEFYHQIKGGDPSRPRKIMNGCLGKLSQEVLDRTP